MKREITDQKVNNWHPGSILRPSSPRDARAEQRNGQVKNPKLATWRICWANICLNIDWVMALMWPSTAFLSYDSVFHISRRYIKMFLGDILKYFFNSTYSVFIPSHIYIYTLFLIITMVISGTLVGSTPVQPNLVVETNGNSGNSSIQVSLSFSSWLTPLLQSPLSSFDSKDDLAQVSLASPPPADFPKNAQVF